MKHKVDVPGPGEVTVFGHILTAGRHTEPAPPERVAELEARFAAGLRLFEPGPRPRVQENRDPARR